MKTPSLYHNEGVFMVYLYVEKIPQFYWGRKKALAKTEKAGKRPPKKC